MASSPHFKRCSTPLYASSVATPTSSVVASPCSPPWRDAADAPLPSNLPPAHSSKLSSPPASVWNLQLRPIPLLPRGCQRAALTVSSPCVLLPVLASSLSRVCDTLLLRRPSSASPRAAFRFPRRHSSLSPLSWPVRGVNINSPAAKSSSLWSETSARGRRWNPASTLYYTPLPRASSRFIDAHPARRSILAAPQLAFTSDSPRSSKEGQRKSHSTPLLSSTRAYPPPTRIRPMCAIR